MQPLTEMTRIEIVVSGRDAPPVRELITVLPPEKAPALIGTVRQLLADGPGVMFVADTYVSRPEYFA